MLSLFRLNNHKAQFDMELDGDLVAALNEATSLEEIERISRLGQQRLSARARAERHHGASAQPRYRVRSQRSSRLRTADQR